VIQFLFTTRELFCFCPKALLTYLLQPDEASPSCDSPKCRSSFNLFVRKHHCRHCGHIFCSEHTAYTIPLDQRAKFHPEGVESRACDSCYREYQKWDKARSMRRKNSENSNTDESGSATPPTGPDNKTLGRRSLHSQQMGAKPSEPVASSVPKDWAWSTF
jgi:FYVE zinc finger